MWESAYKNALELLNVVQIILIRIILKEYNENILCTDDKLKVLQVLTLDQLYKKM